MVTALTCQNIQSREAVAGTGAIEDTGPGGTVQTTSTRCLGY